MLHIYKSKPEEAERLTEIAADSEAWWGYDSEFMRSFREHYRVTEEFLEKSFSFTMEENGKVIGFYSILRENGEDSLEYFYIEPGCIGKGYGKTLWLHLAEMCRTYGIARLILVTSPQAKEFYVKMGAVYTGDVESLVARGRMIPRLEYKSC